jgi:hypothetical protein
MNTASQDKPACGASSDSTVAPIAIPAACSIRHLYPAPDLADAYTVTLPIGTNATPEQLARILFAHQPQWATVLMKIRDTLVAGFGLKTTSRLGAVDSAGSAGRVGFFKIYAATEDEIVLGEDDKHLDFRISLLCDGAAGPNAARRIVVSTVVHCHNRLGRTYIALIAPFHRRIVQASMRLAAQTKWKPVADA